MYKAPVSEISHALKSVAGLSASLDKGLFPDLSDDLVDAILEEAGRFATDRISPLHIPGDRQGARQAYQNCAKLGQGQYVAECRAMLR